MIADMQPQGLGSKGKVSGRRKTAIAITATGGSPNPLRQIPRTYEPCSTSRAYEPSSATPSVRAPAPLPRMSETRPRTRPPQFTASAPQYPPTPCPFFRAVRDPGYIQSETLLSSWRLEHATSNGFHHQRLSPRAAKRMRKSLKFYPSRWPPAYTEKRRSLNTPNCAAIKLPDRMLTFEAASNLLIRAARLWPISLQNYWPYSSNFLLFWEFRRSSGVVIADGAFASKLSAVGQLSKFERIWRQKGSIQVRIYHAGAGHLGSPVHPPTERGIYLLEIDTYISGLGRETSRFVFLATAAVYRGK
ncbi:hypothetical protein DFH07DRAFT_936731 [Mycena maculata]|uniref:Uncharacterized protein n=1 Tax=Mycena maculata TaxID=230809 RepID=A0AAD7NUM6_9AGAR|nr:hypothetical protein DFH07DRAFT_936731 [Mycena maculata]